MNKCMLVYAPAVSISAGAFIALMFAIAPLWVAVLSLIGTIVGVVKLTWWVME